MTQDDRSSELPQIAVVTVVRDEAVMLPRWVAHYSAQLGGPDRLVVIDDNSADGSTDGLPCTVLRMPPRLKGSFEPTRMGMVNGIASGLLAAYDAVIFADADEFLVADPSKYADLRELVADRPEHDVIGAMGLNVVHHLGEEPPLDPARPVLEQRRLAKFLPLMCKPAFPRRMASGALRVTPEIRGRAGNAGCTLHPRSRVHDVVRCAQVHTGTVGTLRHSLCNGLTAYAVLSLETNSSCLHRCRLDGSTDPVDRMRHRQLDTSHGCQNHSVLPYASAPYVLRDVNRSRVASPCVHLPRRRCRVHHIPPRVRDDRDTLLLSRRDARK